MEKKVEISILLDLYSPLLTEKQAETLDLYYNEDLSLSEIAENTNVTRQAVHDALVKGEKFLLETEEKLHLCERVEDLENRLKRINKIIKANGTMEEIISLSEIGE